MAKYKIKEKVILYEERGLKLEMLDMTVGDCQCRIFRQFRWSQTEIELKEFHKLPEWWLRHIKLETLVPYEKEYYEQNKKKMNEYAREWKLQNRDKWNEYQREWKRRKRRKKLEGHNDCTISRNDGN